MPSWQRPERLLEVRMDQFPASVGTLSAQLQELRDRPCLCLLGHLVYAMADAPFALLLVAIFLLAALSRLLWVPVLSAGIGRWPVLPAPDCGVRQ